MNTIVYRVEHSNGYGPYTNPKCEDFGAMLAAKHINKNTHPDLMQEHREAIYDYIRKYKTSCLTDFSCGFRSLRQLRKWFSRDELDEMYELGYKVVTFEIDKQHILYGKCQIAYIKKKSRKVRVVKV